MDQAREWLIRKNGHYYRSEWSGYTTNVHDAGRYTRAEAEREAAIEPWRMTALHISEIFTPEEVLKTLSKIRVMIGDVETVVQRLTTKAD